MAAIDVGYACGAAYTGVPSSWTCFYASNTANLTGQLTYVEVRCNTAAGIATYKVGVLTDGGSNKFTMTGSVVTLGALAQGINTFSGLNIPIASGQSLAGYGAEATKYCNANGVTAGMTRYYNGNGLDGTEHTYVSSNGNFNLYGVGDNIPAGWANISSVLGVASANIASINGVAVADIASINGVAV